MAKTKHRVMSVLLTLCLAVVMLAGMLVAAPVKVKAAGGANYHATNITVNGGVPNKLLDGNNLDVQPGDQISMAILANNTNLTPLTITVKINVSPNIPGLPATVNELLIISAEPESITGPSITIPAGTTGTVVYTFSITLEPDVNGVESAPFTFTLTSIGPPAPTPVRPSDADAYATRHYDFWLPVYTQLMASGNNSSITVSTNGHDIDMIMHFVFDALVGTNRTLTINHKGETYIIRGAAEDKATGTMRGIALGNNYAFTNLQEFMV